MPEIIEDGTGGGYKAGVTKNNQLITKAVTETSAAHSSHEDGQCYAVQAIDADPAAAEYTIWLQNDSSDELVVDELIFYTIDADVVWKVVSVTGTGATAAEIVPVNMNIGSGNGADVTCRGGAGGVTGLTVVNTIWTLYHGLANTNFLYPANGRLILAKNDAVAVEYDAGTTNACTVGFVFHYL